MSVDKALVKSIFMEAVGKESAQARTAYLESACGNDTALRAEVEQFLRSHEEIGDFLDGPAKGASFAAGVLANDHFDLERINTFIGRYKLLELIGEGGFGAVYMALQKEPVRRNVALKVIKLGMDTKQVIARFEAEQQALAMMDHPNIARVLDAGATETGRPYFVMELVHGIPITEYCDQHKLTTTDRLRLFVDVCHAVQHAHQKGIIHRDIKPTNVMVTLHDQKPVPKVIDFGVAKATQQRLTEKTLYTSYRQLIGTPQYMSPEQATFDGSDVDTRSDVYSLGVLLYELLTGTTPFNWNNLHGSAYDEICRTIREVEPQTPSKRVSTVRAATLTVAHQRQVQPPALRKQLRGDLDCIVMKAIEKERNQRFETADALARDVERYLNCEPVLASPPSRIYRLKKTVYRHRGLIASVVAVLIALLVGLVATTTMFFKAQHNQQLAEMRLYVSDMSSAFHAWEEADLARARALLVRHLPNPNERDLRGFEWRYLWGMCQRAMAPNLDCRRIDSVAFSPNGSTLATGSWATSGNSDASVILWDVATRERLVELPQATDVLEVMFSPDGSKLAWVLSDSSITLWDLGSRKEKGMLQKMRPGSISAASLAFSPNGKLLAVGCGGYVGGEIILWDTVAGQQLRSLAGHTSAVDAVGFSPDGKVLASGSWDRTVRLWDPATGQEIDKLTEHNSRVYALAFSSDGNALATGGWDDTVRIWDLETHEKNTFQINTSHDITSLAFASNDELLIVGCANSMVMLLDRLSGETLHILRGHQGPVGCIALSPDGATLASGADDGVKMWDIPETSRTNTKQRHKNWYVRAAVSPTDRDTLAVTSGEMDSPPMVGRVSLWDLAAGHGRVVADSEWPIYCLAFSPDGTLLATGGGQLGDSGPPDGTGVIRLWNVATGKPVGTLDGHSTPVYAVTFSTDGTTLISGDWGRSIKLWDLVERTVRRDLHFEGFVVMSMAVSPDGELLAVGGGNWDRGAIKLVRLATGNEVHTLNGHGSLVCSVAFSADGLALASGSWDGELKLWDVARGIERENPAGHSASVWSVDFSPDGRTLASVGRDHAIKLWHVATGDALARWKAESVVSSVVFLPDGKTLAGAGHDTLQLWHTDEEPQRLRLTTPGPN